MSGYIDQLKSAVVLNALLRARIGIQEPVTPAEMKSYIIRIAEIKARLENTPGKAIAGWMLESLCRLPIPRDDMATAHAL